MASDLAFYIYRMAPAILSVDWSTTTAMARMTCLGLRTDGERSSRQNADEGVYQQPVGILIIRRTGHHEPMSE